MKNKYNARKTEFDGVIFDSKGEAVRWAELKLLQRAGKITELRRQVKFLLLDRQADEKAVHYTCDFMYTENGRTVVEDVKSEVTRKKSDYVIKRKLFKHRHRRIEFREVVR